MLQHLERKQQIAFTGSRLVVCESSSINTSSFVMREMFIFTYSQQNMRD